MRLAAAAGRRALAAAADPPTVDVLVNVGVYRDGNMCEPALASLVARRIPTLARRQDVFAFDLVNGVCGFLSALQVVDTFVRAGTIRGGLVVASDVDPTPGRSRGLALRPAGVAILAVADPAEGFVAFHTETFAEHADLYEARVDWLGPRRWFAGGGHALAVRTTASFAERCAACAAAATRRFLAGQQIALGDLDLVAAPDTPDGFLPRFAGLLGFPASRVVSDRAAGAGTHTAAPGLALAAAVASGRLATARRALLVAVGAGITVSLALYGRTEPRRGA